MTMTLDNKWVYPVLVALFFLVGLAGSPFKYLDGTGHFYLSVLESLDSELFVGDEAVEGLGRFSSVLYPLLGAVAGRLGAGPEHFEGILRALYVATRLASILMILALIRSLGWERRQEVGLFVLFMAWCSHVKVSPVGGVAFFDATMTHRELVFLLLLAAVCQILRGRHLGFWVLLGLSLFLHATRAMNFFFVAAPVLLFLSRSPERRFPLNWIEKQAGGLAVFFGSALLFYWMLAPSPMNAADAEYFLRLKNKINHVSPFSQSPMAWLIISSVAALALLAWRRDLRSDRAAGILAGFVISATVFGLLRGFQAVAYKTVLSTQLVPLRIFIWVWFFSFLLVAMAAVRSGPAPIKVLLVGVVLLSIQNSLLWLLAWTYLGIGYYVAESIPSLFSRWSREQILTAGWLVCWLAMVVFWALGERQPFESLRDPLPMLTGLVLAVVALSGIREPGRWRPLAVAGLIAVSLFSASHRAYLYQERHFGPDWESWRAAASWCRANTGKNVLFITPYGSHSFRNLAFRTSLNELRSELVWVKPTAFQQSLRLTESLQEIRQRRGTGVEDAFCVASEWGAGYVITRSGSESATEPVYENDGYAVFRIPDDACGRAENPV